MTERTKSRATAPDVYSVHLPRTTYWREAHSAIAQKAFFNADTGKAFTTVLAGLALTMTTLPKISFFPAFVAGFKRVLIMHMPGITNLPALFNCCVAICANRSVALEQSAFFISVPSDNACKRAPLLMGFAPAFIAFMGAMIKLCNVWCKIGT